MRLRLAMSARLSAVMAACLFASGDLAAQAPPPGETAALGERLTMDALAKLTTKRARREGMRIFSTPFNTFDGLGDGPMDVGSPTEPGGRPTLQGNGVFLRMNGLDSQTCLECHSQLSTASIPATFAVGGAGGVSANAMPGVVDPDIDDSDGNGFAGTGGRFINPPFSFGSGGIEQLAREMTADLAALAASAASTPDTPVALITKGVTFGSVVYSGGELDTSEVTGVDPDLIVRPFGRKGEFPTIRAFDVGAMQFHFGMQPVEVVGENVDDDGDGVMNELTIGEMSALHLFQVSLERPRQVRPPKGGLELFEATGCATCHVPELTTDSRRLDLLFPDDPGDPLAEVFATVDLSRAPLKFKRSGEGGVVVPLFADLKRHDMGADLAEATGDPSDHWFTTARLWGVADTAPYMHDGRAVTLTEAILMHGGEAADAADAFAELTGDERVLMLDFLRSLHTPRRPNRGL